MLRRMLCAGLATAALALSTPAQAPRIPWLRDPPVFVPGSTTNPLLLYFHDPENRTSRLMETWTFTDPRLQPLIGQFDPVAAAAGRSPQLFERFEVSETPTFLLILPDETVLARHTGIMSGNDLVAWLEESLALVPPPPSEVPEIPSELIPGDPFLDHAPVPIAAPRTTDAPPLLGEGDTAVEPRHRPIPSASAGQPIALQVQIDGGADRVTLHHRAPGESSFHDIVMTPNTPELYYAIIPPEAVTPQGVEYYLFISRDRRSVTLPPAGPGAPHRIAVR